MSPREKQNKFYAQTIAQAIEQGQAAYNEVMRHFAITDLFFLMVYILKREDMDNDFAFERCMVVQEDPDGYLDLWARGHFKSSVITNGLTIQDILKNPNIKIGIFSFNRVTAKSFLNQIKSEFENNELLKDLFPEVLYRDPKKESPRWSSDLGIIVRRSNNPKEATIEATGLVDGMPTGRHYDLLVYDDVVTLDSVNTPESIEKVIKAWEMSLNLGSNGKEIFRYIGTTYHFADCYKTIKERGAAIPRVVPATHDGTAEGKPVFMSEKALADRKRHMGAATFASQMLLDPREESTYQFMEKWMQYWPATHYSNLNVYIVVDPAHSKKKGSDYSVFWVIGLGADENYYIIDCVRDRLNLTEKGNVLFRLYQRYKPIGVGYERYGMQSDIDYYHERMSRENFRFHIRELGGNKVSKEDRIRNLMAPFEAGRMYFPERIIYTGNDGKMRNLVEVFIQEEYLEFPFAGHDDMMDALSRILDGSFNAIFPDNSKYNQWGIKDEEEDYDYDPMDL